MVLIILTARQNQMMQTITDSPANACGGMPMTLPRNADDAMLSIGMS